MSSGSARKPRDEAPASRRRLLIVAASFAAIGIALAFVVGSGLRIGSVVTPDTPDSGLGSQQATSALEPPVRAIPLAETGTGLTTIKSPPSGKVLASVVLPEGFEGASYDVEFAPYGWDPSGVAGRQLVVSFIEVTALSGQTSEFTGLAGIDALLSVSAEVMNKVSVGGSYQGVVEIQEKDGRGLLVLTQVTPAE